MNFTNIEYFLEINRKKSFSKATESLYVTQQTLSQSILNLEKELGFSLFIRSSPLTLTYEGEIFLKYARGFENLKNEMEFEFNNIKKSKKGIIKIGLTYSRDLVYIPKIIYEFEKAYPNYTIQSRSDTLDNLEKQLYNGKLDLALAPFRKSNKKIKLFFFNEEKIILIVNKKLFYNLCGYYPEKKNLIIKDFEKIPFILANPENLSGKYARKFFKKYLIKPTIKAKSDNIFTILELTANGMGACFCPKSLVDYSNTFIKYEDLLILENLIDLDQKMYFGLLPENPRVEIINDFINIATKINGQEKERESL